ncbi:MAG: hypothetical protein ACPHUK_06945, partial [Candidatus Poseidoniaceae archaeon]
FLEQFCTEQQIKIDIHQKVIVSDDFDEEDDEWRIDALNACEILQNKVKHRIGQISRIMTQAKYSLFLIRV